MSTKTKPDLAAALADVSGSSRRRVAPLQGPIPKVAPPISAGDAISREGQGTGSYLPPSRVGTFPITGHFPRQVRDQLKILAIRRSSTLHELMAEAFNDLFAKYGEPEIAPRQAASEGK
jgi:hypothetical protein